MTVAEIGNSTRTIPAAAWAILAAFGIAIVFVGCNLNAPLWFDEANYLSLADGIGRTGYPVWFWKPDQPELFGDSPPGLIYLIRWFSVAVSDNIAALRVAFAIVFTAIPWGTLIVVSRRRQVPLGSLAVAALFATTVGIWLLDLVQVRLDMPVAGLAAGTLIFAAVWIDAGERRARTSLALLGVVLLSGAALLSKYEAACLPAALVVAATADAVWLRNRRTAVVAVAGLIGAATALAILMAWAASYHAASDTGPLVRAMQSNVFGRILPQWDHPADEISNFRWNVKVVLTIAVLPLTALILAATSGALDWQRDALLRLCTFFGVAILAFNIVMYRMPGAGDYYLMEAMLPLGYVLGRSLEAVVAPGKGWRFAAALVLAVSFGLNAPAYLPALLSKPEDAAATALAADLQPTDVLLLGGSSQSRAIPHLLGRSDRYGYLFSVDEVNVAPLLSRRGPGEVGAIVLDAEAQKHLHAPKSAAFLAAVDANFESNGPATPDGPIIYWRRADR